MSSSARSLMLGTLLIIFVATTGSGYLFLIERDQLTLRNAKLSGDLEVSFQVSEDLQKDIQKLGDELVQQERDYGRLEEEFTTLIQDRDALGLQVESLSQRNNVLAMKVEESRQRLVNVLGEKGKLEKRLNEAEERVSVRLPKIVVRGEAQKKAVTVKEVVRAEKAETEEAEEQASPVAELALTAQVVAVNKKHRFLVIDAGGIDGIVQGMQFTIISKKKKPVGRAEVIEIRDRVAALSIIETVRRKKIKEGYLAVQEK